MLSHLLTVQERNEVALNTVSRMYLHYFTSNSIILTIFTHCPHVYEIPMYEYCQSVYIRIMIYIFNIKLNIVYHLNIFRCSSNWEYSEKAFNI